MGLLFWKNNNVIDTFANEIANKFFGTVQPQLAQDYFTGSVDKKQAKKTSKNVDREIQDIIRGIAEFRVIHSLGVYGKARLHMKFRERLEELGYSTEVAERLNEIIMLKTP